MTSSKKDASILEEVIKACEPMLIAIVNQAKEYLDKKVASFERDKKEVMEIVPIRRWISDYANKDMSLYSFLYSIYESNVSHDYNAKGYLKDLLLNKKKKASYYVTLEKEIREYNLFKLTQMIEKYITSDFVKIFNIRLSPGSKGFEVTSNLMDDKNRTWTFVANAISAGGYNIQQFHYRYIVNLSCPEVPKEMVRQRITEEAKKEKEKKVQEKSELKQQKRKDEKAKLVTRLVLDAKKTIKDWAEYGEDMARKQVNEKHRDQEEFDQIESYIRRVKEFLEENIGGMKRKEIYEMALAKNLSASFFIPIIDIIKAGEAFVDIEKYYFNNLERYG